MSSRTVTAAQAPTTSTPSRSAGPVAKSPAPAPIVGVADLGPGRPLPLSTRARMEASFGRPFDGVRVHTEAPAAAATRANRAEALTVGDHVAFGAGRFAPDTPEGTHLLAHELTHVAQGGGGVHASALPGTGDAVSSPHEPAEQVAEATAARVVRGEAVRVAPIGGGGVRARLMRRALDGLPLTPAATPFPSGPAEGTAEPASTPTPVPVPVPVPTPVPVPVPVPEAGPRPTAAPEPTATPEPAPQPASNREPETASAEREAVEPGAEAEPASGGSDGASAASGTGTGTGTGTGEAGGAEVEVEVEAPTAEPGAAPASGGSDRADAASGSGTGEGTGTGTGGGGGLRGPEPSIPPPPTTLGPRAAARMGRAQGAARTTATRAADLPSAELTTGEARGAVQVPAAQMLAEAQGALVEAIGEQPAPNPEIEALCQRIYDAIRAKRPPDEDSLLEADPEEAAAEAGAELDGTVQGDTERVASGYDQLEQGTEGAAPPTPGGMTDESATVRGPEIAAEGAAPDPVPAENLSLEADVASSQQEIDDAGMTTEPAQLVQEGPIAEARAAQGELVETAEQDPAEVAAEQDRAIASSQQDMAALQAQALEALSGSRSATVTGTAAGQHGLVGAEQDQRAAVSQQAQALFTSAQTRVRGLLEPLPRTAMARWETGLPALTRQFRAHLDRVQRWVDDRHSGVGGAIVGLWDSVAGLPDWVTEEYDEAERNFGDGVCDLIRAISAEVETVIAACQRIIADARAEIDALFAALPEDLLAWAEEQRQGFATQLDGLAAETTEARDRFTRDLAQRASQAVQEVREEIHALREAAGGLLGRIADAIAAFIDDPVRAIINGLLSLLGISPPAFWRVVDRLGEVIDAIADDPLGFAANLMEALKQGFQRFFDNIGDHLLQGLLDWLFGSLGSVGVELPRDFSLPSIITFFLQLMGLTWPNIREILVRHVGPQNVELLEQAWQLLSMLIEQGPEGLFNMVREFLSPENIFRMVMDAAIEFVIETLITQVTIRVIGMLNPVGAILQAIEAIYKVVKWVFENAARIFTLVETIVNGAYDLVQGNVSGMAAAIEAGLARLIPPVIDFFASLVGLGDLPEKIADVIRGMQQWILGIVDRVLGALIRRARGLLAALGIGGGAEDGSGPPPGHLERDFSDTEGLDHELTVDLTQSPPRIRVASTEPKGVQRQIQDRRDAVNGDPPDPLNDAQRAALDRAWSTHDQLVPLTTQLRAASDEAEKQRLTTQVQALMADLTRDMVAGDAWPDADLPPTQVSFGPTTGARRVVADPLTRQPGNTAGSEAVRAPDFPPGWRAEVGTQVSGTAGSLRWRRVHLLGDQLHGPGNDAANLAPGESGTNTEMEGIESDAYRRITAGETLRYAATVTPDGTNPFFPQRGTGIVVTVQTLAPTEGRAETHRVSTGAPPAAGVVSLSGPELRVVEAYEALGKDARQEAVARLIGRTQQAVSQRVAAIRQAVAAAPRPLTGDLLRAQLALGLP